MSRPTNIPLLLDKLGVKTKRAGRKLVGLCPSPDHADSSPSWSIIDDGGERSGSHWCFSCGFGGGPWELAAAVLDLTIEEAGEWVTEHVHRGKNDDLELEDIPSVRIVKPVSSKRVEMSLPAGVVLPTVDGVPWHPRALEYLTEERRIPKWQVDRWHIGFATRGRCAWRVVVPIYTGGLLLSYVARAFIRLPVRYDCARRGDPGARPDAAIFGEPGWGTGKVAVITEGVFGALAMERARAPNPTAILGSQSLGPEKMSRLAQRFEVILIATDPDAAGNKAAEEIEAATCRHAVVRRLALEVSPDDASDEANAEAWRDGLRDAWKEWREWRTDRQRSEGLRAPLPT